MPVLINPTHQAHRVLCETVLAMADDVGPQRFLDQLSAQHSPSTCVPFWPASNARSWCAPAKTMPWPPCRLSGKSPPECRAVGCALSVMPGT